MGNPDSRYDSVTITLESDHSPKMIAPLPDEHDLMQFLSKVSDLTEVLPLETKEIKFYRINTIFVDYTMTACYHQNQSLSNNFFKSVLGDTKQ